MQKSLETGYVPGDRVLEAITKALNVETPWSEDDYDLQTLTQYWDVWDVWKMMGGGKPKWVDFDFADKVLCVLNLVDLWREDLADIYDNVVLVDDNRRSPRKVPKGYQRCAAKGCNHVFQIGNPTPQGGGKARKFCSPECRITTANRRQWDKNRVHRYGTPYGTCVNGHDRSPENTYVSPQGKRLCRGCLRENAKKTRERKRLQREAA